jgi:hypothetical protein
MSSSPENSAFWSSLLGIITMAFVGVLYTVGIFLTRQQINKVKREQ